MCGCCGSRARCVFGVGVRVVVVRHRTVYTLLQKHFLAKQRKVRKRHQTFTGTRHPPPIGPPLPHFQQKARSVAWLTPLFFVFFTRTSLVPKKEEGGDIRGDITYKSWRKSRNTRPGEDLVCKLSFPHFLKVKYDTYLQHQQLSLFIKQRVRTLFYTTKLFVPKQEHLPQRKCSLLHSSVSRLGVMESLSQADSVYLSRIRLPSAVNVSMHECCRCTSTQRELRRHS